jgi:hypothetical protein
MYRVMYRMLFNVLVWLMNEWVAAAPLRLSGEDAATPHTRHTAPGVWRPLWAQSAVLKLH